MIIDVGIYHRLEIFIFWILEGGQNVDEGVEDLTRVGSGLAVFRDKHGEEGVQNILEKLDNLFTS